MIEDFLEDMRAAGWLDSQGQFSLNAARAREQLQHSQFRDPHEYVLAIYRCAVLSGASRFDCQVDADDCLLEFDGEPLQAEDFQMLWGTLFMRQDDPSLARLRHLALGINAALGLTPRFVTLESHGWQVRYAGQSEQAGPARTGEKTRVQVRRRTNWQVAQRFLQQLRDLPPEGATIRAACRLGAPLTRVNGRPINEAVTLPPDCLVLGLAESSAPGNRLQAPAWVGPTLTWQRDFAACLALTAQGQARIQFVVAGVGSGQRVLAPDLVGAVSASDLVLNASHSELVEEERFQNLQVQLLEMRDELIVALSRAYPREIPAWLLASARDYLLDASATLLGLPEGPLADALKACPLFRLLDGGQASYDDLIQTGVPVRYTYNAWPFSPELVPHIVHLEAGEKLGILALLERVSADGELKRLRAGLERRLLWEASAEQSARINLPCRARVPLEGMAGELALVESSPSSCQLHKQGRLLHRLELGMKGQLPGLPERILAVASHEGLEMDPSWTRPVPNEALSEVFEALRRAVVALFARLPPDAGPAEVWAFLEFLRHNPDLAPWPPPGRVSDIPCLPTLFAETLSLRELEATRARWGSLYYLGDQRVRIPDPPDEARVDFPIFVLDQAQAGLLGELLPPNTLRPAREHPDVLRRLNYPSFLRRPEGSSGPSGPFLIRQEVAGGFLAVPLVCATKGLELWISFRQRQVCRLTLDWPVGPVSAHFELPTQLRVNAEWNGILPGPALDQWLQELFEETRQLGLRLCEQLASLEERQRARAELFLLALLGHEARRCEQFMEDLEQDPLGSQLLQAPVLEDLQGQRHSAGELLHGSPRVGYVPEPRRLPAGVTETVLLLRPEQLPWMVAIFGASRLVNRTRHLEALDRAGRPPVPLPDGDYLLRFELPGAKIGILRHPSRAVGRVLLCCSGQEVERTYHSGDVPYCGVIDDPALQSDPDWTRVIRDATFQRIMLDVQRRLLEIVDELFLERRELLYLVELWRQLSAYNPLRAQWSERIVLDGWREPVSLGELERRLRAASSPDYLRAEVAEQLRSQVPPDEWPKLTRGLKHPNPVVVASGAKVDVIGRDVGPQLRETARELEFERRQPLDLNLDAHHPEARWLGRVEVRPTDSLQGGELGLLEQWEGEGEILLGYKGIHVGKIEPQLGLAVRGCVGGFFPPSPAMPDDLKDPEAARRLLLPALVGLLSEIVRYGQLAEEVRAVVLLRGWSRLAAPYRTPLESIRCFPLEGGRKADLATLLGQPRLLWGQEGATRPAEGQPRRGSHELLLVVQPGPLIEELRRVLGGRLVELTGTAPPPVPHPAPARAGPRPTLPPVQPGPAALEEQLLTRLRSEFRLLGEGRAFELPAGYLAALQLRPGPSGLLCWFDELGVALNSQHPAVLRSLAPDSPPRHLYLLLSGLFSVINRADENITDVQEREFHLQILETLL